MLTDTELETLLQLNHEVRVAEFKSSGSPSDTQFLGKVARACLAMANQRGGGHVIIGIDDDDPQNGPSGLSDEVIAEWTDFDTLSDRLNRYADPPLSLAVAVLSHPSGSRVIAIEVGEFDTLPVLCKRALDGVLNLGQLYTRSLAKPESTQYHSHTELREVLDLAIEKGLQSFVARARASGLELGAADSERYHERLHSFDVDQDVIVVREGLFFEVTFRPTPFDAIRLDYARLEEALQSAQLRSQSATFPRMGYDFEHLQSAIGWRRPMRANTVLRLDQSGAFVLVEKIRDPGPDFDGFVDADDPGIDGFVAVRDIATLPILALEFCIRLMNVAAIDFAEVELTIGGLQNHALVVNDSNLSGLGRYVYHDAVWTTTVQLSPAERIGGVGEIGVDVVRSALQRFGWSGATDEVVRGIRERYLGA